MRNIKTLAIAAFSILSFAAIAQQPANPPQPSPQHPHKGGPHHERMTPEMRANRWVEHMNNNLALSEEQKIKLREIITKREQQRMADRQTNKDNKEGLKQAAKARHASYEPQIKSVLTPEQYLKLEQIRKERRENRQKHRASHQGATAQPSTPLKQEPAPVDDEVDEY